MMRVMLGAGLAALMIGCGDKDSATDTGADSIGGDDATAAEVWDEIDGYSSWGQLTDHEGVTEATSVHTDYIQIWLNPTALANAEAGEPLADGAIVIKETYSDDAGASLQDISVLKKIDGYYADGNDLFWAQYDADGAIKTSGTPDGCVNCHIGSDSDGDGLTFNE
jgi:hypothetical protein